MASKTLLLAVFFLGLAGSSWAGDKQRDRNTGKKDERAWRTLFIGGYRQDNVWSGVEQQRANARAEKDREKARRDQDARDRLAREERRRQEERARHERQKAEARERRDAEKGRRSDKTGERKR
ncbi:MAG: hypothetical protein SF051_05420 [Elusimicrobiota bacterium]|nr:hypothetical protein [Elusimicrobiota bacterium]